MNSERKQNTIVGLVVIGAILGLGLGGIIVAFMTAESVWLGLTLLAFVVLMAG